MVNKQHQSNIFCVHLLTLKIAPFYISWYTWPDSTLLDEELLILFISLPKTPFLIPHCRPRAQLSVLGFISHQVREETLGEPSICWLIPYIMLHNDSLLEKKKKKPSINISKTLAKQQLLTSVLKWNRIKTTGLTVKASFIKPIYSCTNSWLHVKSFWHSIGGANVNQKKSPWSMISLSSPQLGSYPQHVLRTVWF